MPDGPVVSESRRRFDEALLPAEPLRDRAWQTARRPDRRCGYGGEYPKRYAKKDALMEKAVEAIYKTLVRFPLCAPFEVGESDNEQRAAISADLQERKVDGVSFVADQKSNND